MMKTFAPSRTARRKKTVLVVEDGKRTGGSIRETLGREYRVRLVRSGEEALDLAARLPHLDAVLSEIRLPGMSGLELTRRLREERPDMKVFLMTACPGDASAGQAFALRADGFLAKPFAMETLRDMLLSRLGFSAP